VISELHQSISISQTSLESLQQEFQDLQNKLKVEGSLKARLQSLETLQKESKSMALGLKEELVSLKEDVDSLKTPLHFEINDLRKEKETLERLVDKLMAETRSMVAGSQLMKMEMRRGSQKYSIDESMQYLPPLDYYRSS